MATSNEVKEQYDALATGYDNAENVPTFLLGTQLLNSALGDCTGLLVLDLGGGTGVHARVAVDAGARQVDVVDISPGMMLVGQAKEEELGRVGRIRWFEADVTKPMDHLPLHRYDIVMSNYLFDHAANVEELEAMWRNLVAYLKPGGRFVGARVGNPRAACLLSGQYGETYKDHEDIPGGTRYRFKVHLKTPVEFEGSSLQVSYSGSTEMHHKFGLCDVETEPLENAPTVRDNFEFWSNFKKDPGIAVVKARKAVAA